MRSEAWIGSTLAGHGEATFVRQHCGLSAGVGEDVLPVPTSSLCGRTAGSYWACASSYRRARRARGGRHTPAVIRR